MAVKTPYSPFADLERYQGAVFNEKYKNLQEQATKAIGTFSDALAAAVEKTEAASPIIEEISNLHRRINTNLEELQKLASLSKNGRWVAKAGVELEAMHRALHTYENSQNHLMDYFAGIRDLTAPLGTHVPKEVSSAFTAAREAAEKVTKVADNPFWGKLRTQGFTETVVSNAKDMNFLQSGQTLGQRGVAFAKVGLVTAALVTGYNAVAHSHKANGEKRSLAERSGKFAAAVTLIAAVMLTGRVKVQPQI